MNLLYGTYSKRWEFILSTIKTKKIDFSQFPLYIF